MDYYNIPHPKGNMASRRIAGYEKKNTRNDRADGYMNPVVEN